MRSFWLIVVGILLSACTTTPPPAVQPAPEPVPQPTPEPEYVEVRTLPSETECRGFFAVIPDGPRLDRGTVRLKKSQSLHYYTLEGLTDAEVDQLSSVGTIERIDLQDCDELTPAGFKKLGAFSHATSLSMYGETCTPEVLGEISSWKSLKSLILDAEGEWAEADFEPLSVLPNLRRLDVCLPRGAFLLNLEVDTDYPFRKTRFYDGEMSGGFLKHLPNTISDLSVTKVGLGVTPRFLNELPEEIELKTLRIRGDWGSRTLELTRLRTSRDFSELSLAGSRMVPEKWRELGHQLQALESLRSLDLSRTDVPGLSPPETITSLPLHELNLEGVWNVGAWIENIPQHGPLRRLRLDDTGLSDGEFIRLSKLRNLEDVWIPEQISDESIARFRKLRPDVRINPES